MHLIKWVFLYRTIPVNKNHAAWVNSFSVIFLLEETRPYSRWHLKEGKSWMQKTKFKFLKMIFRHFTELFPCDGKQVPVNRKQGKRDKRYEFFHSYLHLWCKLRPSDRWCFKERKSWMQDKITQSYCPSPQKKIMSQSFLISCTLVILCPFATPKLSLA